MRTTLHFIIATIVSAVCMTLSQSAFAQTASINFTQVNNASCSGGGSVTGIVSVPGACSINGYVPCVNASLTGPGQSGASFNTCDNYQVGANGLAPGDYVYTLTSISPCSGTATFPFTIENDGVYPDIDITTVPVDCNDDDYVTVQNNTSVSITMGESGGGTLGTIAAGQSADYPNTSLNYTLTASTSSCPTPVEYPVEYQSGPGQYPFGFPTVEANTSSSNATNGQNNGSATVNITSGAGPFTISWSNGTTVNGEITSTIQNLGQGSYTVTVTDNNGCTFVETVEVMSDGSSSVESLSALLSEVKVIPNPATGNRIGLQLESFSAQALSISVLDITGKEVIPMRSIEVGQGSNRIDLDVTNGLTNGVYQIRIMSGDLVGSVPLLYSK